MFRCVFRSLSLLALVFLMGCRADEGITEYQVPRETRNQAQRLRVAILVDPNQGNWFFKLLGSSEAVAEHEKDFSEFVKSLRLKDRKPEWVLPAGWSEVDNPAIGMRYKTLRTTPNLEQPLDVAVSQAKGDLLANINRWRRQDLNLPEFATEAEMREAKPPVLVEIPLPDLKLVLVDMTGTKPRKAGPGMPMMPPVPETKAAPSGRLTFTVPPKWKQTEPAPGGFIKIDYAFRVSPESTTPEVTITQLGGLNNSMWRGNLDRWRGQVGLPPLEELPKDQPTLKVDGKECPYVDFAGPQKRILVVVAENGPTTWYIKLFAPVETVAKNKSAFETFVKSIRFEPVAGAKP